MQNWHRQFLGRTQMPSTLSAFVISEFFTLNQSERQSVLSRYGVDMRLGTALQIGFLKMRGRPLDRFQRVPFAVLEHLNAQVGASPPDLATLRALLLQRAARSLSAPANRARRTGSGPIRSGGRRTSCSRGHLRQGTRRRRCRQAPFGDAHHSI